MKKSSVAFIVLAIIGAYFLGAYLGFPFTSGTNGKGDISKVSKYNNISVSPASSAFQEKILSDSTTKKEAEISLCILTGRMADFSTLVDMTLEYASDKEAFAAEIEHLKAVKTLADNAVQSGKVALASYNYLINGEKSEDAIDFEQASQNLTLAYLLVDRQVKLGKDFVVAADDYLRKNSVSGNEDIAAVRDLWADYCAGSAILNGDEQELAYWDNKKNVDLIDAQFSIDLNHHYLITGVNALRDLIQDNYHAIYGDDDNAYFRYYIMDMSVLELFPWIGL